MRTKKNATTCSNTPAVKYRKNRLIFFLYSQMQPVFYKKEKMMGRFKLRKIPIPIFSMHRIKNRMVKAAGQALNPLVFVGLTLGASAQVVAETLAECPQGSAGDHPFRSGDLSKCMWVTNDHGKYPAAYEDVDYNIYCPGRMTQADANRVGAEIVAGALIRDQGQREMNPVVGQHQRAGLVPQYRSVPHRFEYACWLTGNHAVATHIKLRVHAEPSETGGHDRNCRFFGSQNGDIALNARMDREYKCSGLFHRNEKGETVWRHAQQLVERDFADDISRVNGKACILRETDIQCAPCTRSDKLIVRLKTVPAASDCPENTVATIGGATQVSLSLYWSAKRGDNASITTPAGTADARAARYIYVRNQCSVYADKLPGTVPIKLYWSEKRGDNASIATPEGEADQRAAGYRFVRNQGYVYPTKHGPATLPIKLYWHAGRGDNASITTPVGEADARAAGYEFIRTEGYCIPLE